jgi:hypothetical protein
MSKKASPTKLRSGGWGARVDGSCGEGDRIQVTTKGGKSWDASVRRVVWSGNGVSIVETQTLRSGCTPAIRDKAGYVVERGRHEGYCGHPCPVSGLKCCPKNGPCHDCV